MSPVHSSPALHLGRQLALTGAAAAMVERGGDDIDPARPFADAGGEFQALGKQMREWLQSGHATTERLTKRLGLSESAYWVLALCAACERYPDVAAAFSIMAEDERTQLPTAHTLARLIASALDQSYEAALLEACPGAPVEQLRLCERLARGNQPFTHAALRLTAHEMRLQLLGEAPDHEQTSLTFQCEVPQGGTAFERARVQAACSLVQANPLVFLRGTRRAARQFAFDLGSALEEQTTLVLVEDSLPDVDDLVRMREGLCVIDLTRFLEGRSLSPSFADALAQRTERTVLLVPPNAHSLGAPTVTIPELDTTVASRVWALALREHSDPSQLGAEVATLSQRFRLSFDEARDAVRGARDRSVLEGAPSLVGAVSEEVLAEGGRKMGRTIATLPPGPGLDDLVAPELLKQTLHDMVGSFRARGARSPLLQKSQASFFGRGLACLFSGPPGTGKTFAARCVASALGLNLYRIDLSQVVSKYIGETEKALSRVFEEAEAGHGILLFDEADALFGKRSDVKDAHDRYANVEVAYLLQRMESFDGMSILTTNLRNNLDVAFIRRLRFVIEFPIPDRLAREQLWRQSLPEPELWDASVEVAPLAAAFGLSGGDIFNIGMASAHLAAAEGMLSMRHVVRATYRELEKVGLPRTRDDFGKLAAFLPREVQ